MAKPLVARLLSASIRTMNVRRAVRSSTAKALIPNARYKGLSARGKNGDVSGCDEEIERGRQESASIALDLLVSFPILGGFARSAHSDLAVRPYCLEITRRLHH